MAKGQGKTGLIVTIIVLALTLGVVSAIVIYQNVNRPVDTTTADTQNEEAETPAESTTEEEQPEPEPEQPNDGPGDMKSIDVEPMSIKVYYGEGTDGFEFLVKRANGGTQYAEFSTDALVGTKCTDDQGIFATIVEDPSTSEQQTTADQTVSVDGMTYGLLLASDSCTSNPQLLATYQDAFRQGFGFLTAL